MRPRERSSLVRVFETKSMKFHSQAKTKGLKDKSSSLRVLSCERCFAIEVSLVGRIPRKYRLCLSISKVSSDKCCKVGFILSNWNIKRVSLLREKHRNNWKIHPKIINTPKTKTSQVRSDNFERKTFDTIKIQWSKIWRFTQGLDCWCEVFWNRREITFGFQGKGLNMWKMMKDGRHDGGTYGILESLLATT